MAKESELPAFKTQSSLIEIAKQAQKIKTNSYRKLNVSAKSMTDLSKHWDLASKNGVGTGPGKCFSYLIETIQNTIQKEADERTEAFQKLDNTTPSHQQLMIFGGKVFNMFATNLIEFLEEEGNEGCKESEFYHRHLPKRVS